MKRVFVFILTALIAVSLTACNKSEEKAEISNDNSVSTLYENSEQSEEISEELSEQSEKPEISQTDTSSSDDNRASDLISMLVDKSKLSENTRKSVIDVLESDSFYMNIEGNIVIFGAVTSNFDVEIAKSNNNTLEIVALGNQKMKFITNEKGTYTVDDKKKTAILTVPAKNNENSVKNSDNDSYTSNELANKIISYFASSLGLDSVKFKQSGNEEYEGKKYDFDEYTSDKADIKLYFDNSSLKYIVSTDKKDKQSVIKFNSLSSSPDSSLFEIPNDYTIR